MAPCMVTALVPGASGPGWSPARGHCVVFLGKALYSHSAGQFNAGVTLHPIQGGVEILLAASGYTEKPGCALAWWVTWLVYSLYLS